MSAKTEFSGGGISLVSSIESISIIPQVHTKIPVSYLLIVEEVIWHPASNIILEKG